jgi:hypothetical protein
LDSVIGQSRASVCQGSPMRIDFLPMNRNSLQKHQRSVIVEQVRAESAALRGNLSASPPQRPTC